MRNVWCWKVKRPWNTRGISTLAPSSVVVRVFLVALLLGGVCGKSLGLEGPSSASTNPGFNLIFIMADDLGYADLGCYGSTFHETPNLDRLATRGVRLTQAYAASPLCSPTRASILTGQYPARIGITSPSCHLPSVQLVKRLVDGKNGQDRVLTADSLTRLKSDYVTLAESLQRAGYRTAHFGKWHLGHNLQASDRYEPRDQGFQFDFPHTPKAAGPGGGYLAPWKFIQDAAIKGEPGKHIEDRMSEEAAAFIEKHKAEPFYMNYWAFSVHSPWNARRDYIDHFAKKVDSSRHQKNPLYAAMVRSLDDGVGRILEAVDRAGIADRTIVVFTSDNGGWAYPPKATDPEGYADIPATSNAPLRSGKASLYEGGTREPCLVVWPKTIQPGTVQHGLLSSVDWFPTLHAMLGVSLPENLLLDGIEQSSMLLGKKKPRQEVFCHFPHGSVAQSQSIPGFRPGSWVRDERWKLIRFYADHEDGSDRWELYDLQNDVGEKVNVVAEHPEIMQRLSNRLGQYLAETDAVIPKRNPNYGASKVEKGSNRDGDSANLTLGWKARQCSARALPTSIEVHREGANPFFGYSLGSAGPLEVRVRMRGGEAGQGKVEWIPQKQGKAEQGAAESISFMTQGKDWEEIAIQIPPTERIGILRVYFPANWETFEVDWIEVQTKSTPRRWDFGNP